MTREIAKQVAQRFEALGGFSDVALRECGFGSGKWAVQLWNMNPRSGNRNLHDVRDKPADDKAYAAIRKEAMAAAGQRDKQTRNRMKAEREVNQS